MKALSIHQPWAWLIVNGFKDVENRDWPTNFRGRFLIHAASTMTRPDYEACVIFCSGIAAEAFEFPEKFEFPSFEELKKQCGGIVGEATLTTCTVDHNSPWFNGPFGFVLNEAKAIAFEPFKGRLGFFEIERKP